MELRRRTLVERRSLKPHTRITDHCSTPIFTHKFPEHYAYLRIYSRNFTHNDAYIPPKTTPISTQRVRASSSMRQDGFIAEDAVEGGAADAELAGGAQLVVPVQVQDILHVMLNDRIQIQVAGTHRRLQLRRGSRAGGQGQIVGTDDAVDGFQQSGLQHRGQLPHVSRPTVLQEAGQSTGPQDHGAVLVAAADAVQQRLGERRNVFSSLPQRWNGKADGGEAEG